MHCSVRTSSFSTAPARRSSSSRRSPRVNSWFGTGRSCADRSWCQRCQRPARTGCSTLAFRSRVSPASFVRWVMSCTVRTGRRRASTAVPWRTSRRTRTSARIASSRTRRRRQSVHRRYQSGTRVRQQGPGVALEVRPAEEGHRLRVLPRRVQIAREGLRGVHRQCAHDNLWSRSQFVSCYLTDKVVCLSSILSTALSRTLRPRSSSFVRRRSRASLRRNTLWRGSTSSPARLRWSAHQLQQPRTPPLR